MEEYRDPKKRAQMLASEERGKWLKVDELIRDKAGITAGMTCIDLGCGAGVFSLPLVKSVGKKGKVYAVDINADVLEILREKNPPANLVILQKDAADTGLDAGIADVCLMVLLLHEVPPEKVLKEAYRLLKTEGRVLVMEWRMDYDSPHPPHNERLSKERIKQLLTGAGFTSVEYTDWTGSHYVATSVKK
jgi:SAM-dependent methyltransferase